MMSSSTSQSHQTIDLIDVLGESGAKTGQQLSRLEVHEKGLWHASSWLWLHDGRGGILLQRRSESKPEGAGKLDISAAGHVGAGEDHLTAAIREAEEEIGLSLVPNRLELIDSFADERPDRSGKIIHRQHIQVFLAQIDPDEIGELEVEEVAEVKWISVDDLVNDLKVNYDNYVPHPMSHYQKIIDLVRAASG